MKPSAVPDGRNDAISLDYTQAHNPAVSRKDT